MDSRKTAGKLLINPCYKMHGGCCNKVFFSPPLIHMEELIVQYYCEHSPYSYIFELYYVVDISGVFQTCFL